MRATDARKADLDSFSLKAERQFGLGQTRPQTLRLTKAGSNASDTTATLFLSAITC